MRKSKIITRLVAVTLVMAITLMPTLSFATDTISLSLNDQYMNSDTAPLIKEGRTLVPIRVITENLNCEVTWDNANKAVIITEADGGTLSLVIGSKEGAKTDGSGTVTTFKMDVAASIINGRTMVPIRAISENLSSAPQIGWSSKLKKVCILTKEYIAQKGITDVKSYVENLKETVNMSNIQEVGLCDIYVDGSNSPYKDCSIINADEVFYMKAYDYFENVRDLNVEDIYVEDNYIGCKDEFWYYGRDYVKENYTEFTEFYVGNYGVTYYKNLLIEGNYEEKGTPTTSEDYEYPIIEYKGDIYVPLTGGLYKDGQFSYKTGISSSGLAYSNLVILSSYYLEKQELAKKQQEEKAAREQAEKAKQQEASQNIKAGDTVYATAVFFKCWGTVQTVSGSKAQVQWSQVTDMYGMLVPMYASEMDIYSQLSMKQKGVMIGNATWVEIANLNK